MSGRVARGGVVEATLAQMMGEDEIGERHLLVSFERGQGRSTRLGRLDCVFGPDRHTGNLTSVRAAELPIPFSKVRHSGLNRKGERRVSIATTAVLGRSTARFRAAELRWVWQPIAC